MKRQNRIRTWLRRLAVVTAAVGGALAVGATAGVLPARSLSLVSGLVLLAAAVGTLAVAAYVGDSRESADAAVVMGFVSLHLLTLVVALLAAALALLAGNGFPWRVPVAWGVASAAALAVSYGWDRWTATDVDAVLEESSWYRQ